MKIEDHFDVAVPISDVYTQINDIGQIGYCIAGVQKVDVISADRSEWIIVVRVGFMARTFRIDGEIVDRKPPNVLAFAGKTQDAEVRGVVTLTELDPNTTRCAAAIEIEVTGALSSLVDQVARGPQQKLIRETIENLRVRLEGDSTVAGTHDPVVRPEPKPGRMARLRAWIRHKRARRAAAVLAQQTGDSL